MPERLSKPAKMLHWMGSTIAGLTRCNTPFLFGTALVVFGTSLVGWATSIEIDDAEVLRVMAVSQDIAYGQYLAVECASCHSIVAVAESNVPVIHGADAISIARALLEYRSGARANTTMANVANSLGDEEIAVLAQYLATQSR